MATEDVPSKPDDEESGTMVVATDDTGRQAAAADDDDDRTKTKTKIGCCDLYYDRGDGSGNVDAIGYNYIVIGRGMLIIANITLTTSFLHLASKEAGCYDDPDYAENGGECKLRVRGIRPSSFITNMNVIAGLVTAFLMPLAGACIDFTAYRRAWGMASAAAMTVVQAAQIGTVESTWFAMIVLQGLAAVFYQVQNLALYAYIPEIGRDLGETDMTSVTAHFVSNQFGAQALMLIVVGIVRIAIEPSIVDTGRIGQCVNTATCVAFFGLGWFRFMTARPAVRELPPGRNLFTAGFRQNRDTVANLQKHFRKGLRWFFLAVIFAQSSAGAAANLSVIYLQDVLKMDQTQIVYFFLSSMVGSAPGSHLGRLFTIKTDPKISYMWSCVALYVVMNVGVITLEGKKILYSYLWAFGIGMGLGWFYSTENLFYAMVLPKGQEAELSGFYVFSSLVLVWLPPLLFTIIIENDVAQKYGWVITTAFLPVAAVVLLFAAPWDEIVAEAVTGIEAIKADREATEIEDNPEADWRTTAEKKSEAGPERAARKDDSMEEEA